ncbi:MAG: rubrerythrin family protein [Treponema sp.]|nr:rubrerythrin family protein [Treponema sp.]
MKTNFSTEVLKWKKSRELRQKKNLQTAFAGESQARNKYTYYASKARKDGFEQIADIFEETARNEKEHAKIWFKLLHGGEVPSTAENLKYAADGDVIWQCANCGHIVVGKKAPGACPVCLHPQSFFEVKKNNY